MSEREPNRKTLTRREVLKGAVVFGGLGLTAVTGVTGTVYLMDRFDKEFDQQQRSDHYKGIPLEEYAKGTFTVDFDKVKVTSDPVLSPMQHFNTSHIYEVNGRDDNGGVFNVSNPAVVRGKDPTTLVDNAVWMVLQARGSFDEGSRKTVYVFLPETAKAEGEKTPVQFGRLTTASDGTHTDPLTGKPVEYLGAITYPQTYNPAGHGL